jgi:hypothetical protein
MRSEPVTERNEAVPRIQPRETTEEYVQRVVDAAPPLTPEGAERLRVLLRRETSPYTLRFPSQEVAERVAAHLQIVDHGAVAITFRAGGDEEAIQVATDALAAAGETGPAELTTGLGTHKRRVAVQP